MEKLYTLMQIFDDATLRREGARFKVIECENKDYEGRTFKVEKGIFQWEDFWEEDCGQLRFSNSLINAKYRMLPYQVTLDEVRQALLDGYVVSVIDNGLESMSMSVEYVYWMGQMYERVSKGAWDTTEELPFDFTLNDKWYVKGKLDEEPQLPNPPQA